jgi:IclR family KDG regulon transcriptional repressor
VVYVGNSDQGAPCLHDLVCIYCIFRTLYLGELFMQATKSVPAVERAFAILEALSSSSKNMNIAELSRKLSIPRSSAHVITLTLERCGYLTRDASRRNCSLSNKTFGFGRNSIPSEQLADVAYKLMESLSVTTQLTSHLAVLDHGQALYVQKVQVSGSLHFNTHIGKRTNLYCTAIGKVLLAYTPKAYQQKILSHGTFLRNNRDMHLETSTLRDELTKIAAHGYALHDRGRKLSVHHLAVPVISKRGELLAALSVAGVVFGPRRLWFQKWIEPLQQVARQIGHHPSLNSTHHDHKHSYVVEGLVAGTNCGLTSVSPKPPRRINAVTDLLYQQES